MIKKLFKYFSVFLSHSLSLSLPLFLTLSLSIYIYIYIRPSVFILLNLNKKIFNGTGSNNFLNFYAYVIDFSLTVREANGDEIKFNFKIIIYSFILVEQFVNIPKTNWNK